MVAPETSSKEAPSRVAWTTWLLISLVVVALSAAGIYTLTRPSPPEKAALERVVINQAFEHLLYLGLYVAKDRGFFQEEGLDVQIDTGGGDDKAFAALASGSADFAQGDPAFVAIARQRGWDGRVVAMAVDRVAIWGIARDPSIRPFSDPTGFRGRRVATYPNPNTAYVVQQELAQRAGLRIGRDTQIVQVAFGSELAALQRGQVDIAQTIEPNVSAHELAGGTVVFSYPEAWGSLAFTGVMTSQRLIRERPHVVQGFLNAYERALAYIHANRQGALEVARRRLPDVPPATLERALNRLISSGAFPRHTRVDPASWRSLLEVRVRVGDLPALPSEVLYDNRFADRAIQSQTQN